MSIEKIIKELSKSKSISNVRVLGEKEKKKILKLEDEENIGVLEALSKKHTLVFSKKKIDETELVKEKGKFPLIKIKEKGLEDDLSALPGFEVHKRLSKEMDLDGEDITVLVGIKEELKEIEAAIKKEKKTGEPIDVSEEFKFVPRERDLKVFYETSLPELGVDYSELFSYLNTRPTGISYDYEFSETKDEGGEVLNYEMLERINRKRKMEKTIYFGERKDYIPEGVSATELEHFNVYRLLSFGRELNKILYEHSLS